MRIGVLIGVVAFGLLFGIGVIVYGVINEFPLGKTIAVALGLVFTLTVAPIAYAAYKTKTHPFDLLQSGDGPRRTAVIAILTFGVLVSAPFFASGAVGPIGRAIVWGLIAFAAATVVPLLVALWLTREPPEQLAWAEGCEHQQ